MNSNHQLTKDNAPKELSAAGPNRPANVPAEYRITPFGYFHPTCVAHITSGDNVRRDLKIVQHANGTKGDTIHECTYPHFKADGRKIFGNERATEKKPNIAHDWIEYSSSTTSQSFGYMYANFNVPPAPANNDGQTVFLFPGMED